MDGCAAAERGRQLRGGPRGRGLAGELHSDVFWSHADVCLLRKGLGIILAKQYAGRFQNFSWSDAFRQWPRRGDGSGGSASRPLLTESESQIEEVDEETGEAGRENGHRYGATDNSGSGPRIEPSGLVPERNEWRDE